jgi:hypothetical protein
MATLKIEPGSDGRLWVILTHFCDEDIARLKRIPGHRWNPERKQWQFPDTVETRAALAEIVKMPPSRMPEMLAVSPPSLPFPRHPKPATGEGEIRGRQRYGCGEVRHSHADH